MAYIGKEPIVGNFQKCDAITVVNGQAAYTLQVSSTNVVPESANHMLVSLNGILQAPVTSFTVSGSTLTFASNLATGDVIDFVILLGNVLDLGTPSDGTVTNAKLASDLISGETDIGGAIADADLFLIDDGAGGTLRKTAASRIKTYASGTNTPMVEVKPAGNQSISTNTWTKVTLDSEQIDTDNTFASDKWTPGFVGKVFIVGITYIASLGDEKLYMNQIYKNGSATGVTNIKNSGKGDDVTNEVSGIFTTDADDYFELYVHQQDGSSLNNIANSTRFYGFKLLT